MAKQNTTDTTTTTNIDPDVKTKLDLAWGKIENGLAQETEGRKLWVDGTLELINILDDARNRFPSDKEFGAWLTDNGYGEDRITRNDRRALLNMAEHPQHTREVLNQTHRRSWRLIWEEEIQPLLHSAVQPADGESPEATPTNNSEQPADGESPEENPANNSEGEKKTTRRPKKGNGTKKPRTEWGKDLKDFMSDGVLAANALIRIRQAISSSTPAKQAELLKKVTSGWLRQIEQGHEAGAWICDWANEGLDKEVDKDIQTNRVVLTPAPASQQIQPEA